MIMNNNAPGRIGNPDIILQDDPRLLPALRKTFIELQMGGRAHVDPPKDPDAYHAYVGELDRMANQYYEMLDSELPGDKDEPTIQPEEIIIDGLDGNRIKLHIFHPPDIPKEEQVPAVLYIHGGAMMYLKALAKPHIRWAKSLALKGVVSIIVDFRNVWNEGEYCPYPAGLNDCVAAVKYIHAHKSTLGISKIVLQGESGGGNLVLATALKTKKAEYLDGVYAYCPYIAGMAHGREEEWKVREMQSAVENDGYIQESAGIPPAAKYYSPKREDWENPLAWPYFAKAEDLRGLPPHAISLDELDTLRDEGLVYVRKLVKAGVRSTAEVGLGMPHGSRLMFRKAIPEEYEKLVDSIVAFARGL